MKKNKVKVAFLLDKQNDWLLNYLNAKKFQNYLNNLYKISLVFNQKNLAKYEIVFVLGYTKILKNQLLKRCKNIFLIHESKLPKGKGFSPIQWQILQGINLIDVCLIRLVERFDSGPIILRDRIKFDGTELYDEIRKKQFYCTERLIKKFLKNYPKISQYIQKGKQTYYRKRHLKDSKLNISKTIKSQFNLLRICNNSQWPAFFYFKNKKYLIKIFKTHDK